MTTAPLTNLDFLRDCARMEVHRSVETDAFHVPDWFCQATNPHARLLIGAPGSGKSWFAAMQIRQGLSRAMAIPGISSDASGILRFPGADRLRPDAVRLRWALSFCREVMADEFREDAARTAEAAWEEVRRVLSLLNERSRTFTPPPYLYDNLHLIESNDKGFQNLAITSLVMLWAEWCKSYPHLNVKILLTPAMTSVIDRFDRTLFSKANERVHLSWSDRDLCLALLCHLSALGPRMRAYLSTLGVTFPMFPGLPEIGEGPVAHEAVLRHLVCHERKDGARKAPAPKWLLHRLRDAHGRIPVDALPLFVKHTARRTIDAMPADEMDSLAKAPPSPIAILPGSRAFVDAGKSIFNRVATHAPLVACATLFGGCGFPMAQAEMTDLILSTTGDGGADETHVPVLLRSYTPTLLRSFVSGDPFVVSQESTTEPIVQALVEHGILGVVADKGGYQAHLPDLYLRAVGAFRRGGVPRAC